MSTIDSTRQPDDAAGEEALHDAADLLADGADHVAVHRAADVVQNGRSLEERRDAAGEALEFLAAELLRVVAHRQQDDLANELVDLLGHPRDADAEHRLLPFAAEDRFEIHRGVLQTLEEQVAQPLHQRWDVSARLHEAVVRANLLARSLQEEKARFRFVAQTAEQAADATTIRSRAVLRKELRDELRCQDLGLGG